MELNSQTSNSEEKVVVPDFFWGVKFSFFVQGGLRVQAGPLRILHISAVIISTMSGYQSQKLGWVAFNLPFEWVTLVLVE